MKNGQLVSAIEDHVKAESQKTFEKAIEEAKVVNELERMRWELGRPLKEGTNIEKALHNLVYLDFSRRIQLLIDDHGKEIIRKHRR